MQSHTLKHLVPFVAAAEHHSFTAAARALRVTPSAVSKAIQKLEDELGVVLIERTPRKVALTTRGEHFYQECKRALTAIEVAKNSLAEANQTVSGQLRLSLPVGLGEHVIVPALPAWLRANPELTVDSTLTDLCVDVEGDQFDAVVRIGKSPHTALKRHALPSIRWVTVASPAYLERCGTPRNLAQLKHHHGLQYILSRAVPQPWHFAHVKTKGERIGEIRFSPTRTHSSNHASTLVHLTLAGFGLLQVHRYFVETFLASGALVEVLAKYQPQPLPVAVLFSKNRGPLPRVRAFIELMDSLLKH